jgi:hypothetical protein
VIHHHRRSEPRENAANRSMARGEQSAPKTKSPARGAGLSYAGINSPQSKRRQANMERTERAEEFVIIK